MNLTKYKHLWDGINRRVTPEAKRWLGQAKLVLGKVEGESLLKLLFRFLIHELIRDVLKHYFADLLM